MKRFILLFLVAIITSGLIFMSCSEPTMETTATATTTATTSATVTTTATAEPQYGGILRLHNSLPLDVPFGNPLLVFGPFVWQASVTMERLLLMGEEVGSLRYVLATGYELAPDKSYYDISLRQGAKFHDGTDFNAEAVKWNLDRVVTTPRAELRTVESVEVIDDYNVRINLSSWTNQVLYDLTHDCCCMISPTAFEENGEDWANINPVGTGPFMYNAAESNSQIHIFDRNPDYWEEGLPYLDRVELHFIPDSMTFMAALEAGEVDGTTYMSLTNQEALKGNPNFKMWLQDGELLRSLKWNSVDPESVWSDVRMRQAFEYAIDKKAVVESIGDPYMKPIYNNIKGLEEVAQENIVPRTYDPDKAKELMAAAGHPHGIDVTIHVTTALWGTGGGGASDLMLPWQEQWAVVGFNVEYDLIDAAVEASFNSAPMPGNDLLYTVVRGSNKNPLGVAVENYATNTIYMNGVKTPDEWPALLEQALKAEDTDVILALCVQMDELAYENAMLFSLYNGPQVAALNTRVNDLEMLREGYILSHAWVSE